MSLASIGLAVCISRKSDKEMSTYETTSLAAPRAQTSGQTVARWMMVPGILLILAYLPLLLLHARELWDREHYQFFPLVLVGTGILAVGAWREHGTLKPGSLKLSALFISISWFMLAAAGYLYSPWLGAVATLVMLMSVIYSIGGRALAWRLLPAWAFLCLIIPPPLELDYKLISLLQTLTSRVSSPVLDMLNVYHAMEGNVVSVSGQRLLVEQACSGIHSLFVVFTCTLFFVFWSKTSAIRGIVLLLASVIWVLLGNVVRVVTVAFFKTHRGVDLSTGWRHELLGLVVFITALGLIVSTDRLLLFITETVRLWWNQVTNWFRRSRSRKAKWGGTVTQGATTSGIKVQPTAEPIASAAASEASGGLLPDLRRTWLLSWPFLIAFGILAAAQLALLWKSRATVLAPVTHLAPEVTNTFQSVEEDQLPENWGPFRRQGFKTQRVRGNTKGLFQMLAERVFNKRMPWTPIEGAGYGGSSRVWEYQLAGYPVAVSVDYPFKGWHELTSCYEAQGWEAKERVVHRDETDGSGRGPVVEATLEKPPAQHGFLLFCLYDLNGGSPEPFESQPVQGGVKVPSFQVQLFIDSEYPLTPDEQSQAREFFQVIRRDVRKMIGKKEASS